MPRIHATNSSLLRPVGLALWLIPSTALAQQLTNHALGKAYRVQPAPAQRYADSQGPEQFVADAPYRGELTDGNHGPPNYKASQWVGWRDTNYVEPIRVTVDLGQPRWVDRVEVTVCGGPDSIEPPERVEVWVRSPSFPYDSFVQVGQMVSDVPYEAGPGKVYRFVLSDCGWTVDQVRLDFQERTWQYLFVDEIKILGGASKTPRILPAQDFVLEAETGQTTGGPAAPVKGASGTAVLLSKTGSSVTFGLPLPGGDYTVRVRSMAKQPDTFSELAPRCGGARMRAQPVTNSVFTWQRSHFTHDSDGTAEISLTLAEGAGVYVDQVRIHRLTLNEPLESLKQFSSQTQLVEEGDAGCLVVADDAGRFAAQAARVCRAIEERSGVRPSLKRGNEVTDDDFRQHHLIALGDRVSNFALLKASPNAWNHIPTAPEEGTPQVYVAVDPKGAGKNVVALGGADSEQVRKSADAFLDRLTGKRTLVLPWTLLPPPNLVTNRERYKELAVESGKWIRQGAIRQLENQWKAYADDIFLLLAYRYLEYKDSRDTIKQVSRDGFIEAELYKLVCRFDRSEHNGSFTRLQRLQLTNTLLHMARQCAGIFDWECAGGRGGKRYHKPEETDQILAERKPTIANNHQTFPVYTLLTAGDYFSKYYDLPEAKRWLRWTDAFMKGQLLTSKPQCDCWGYQDITTIHTARYAAATGRWDYFDSDSLHQFLRLRFISHDNLGGGVGYGDVGTYRPPAGPDFRAQNAENWTRASGTRLDLERIDPSKLLGVYVHPLEPMWYDFYGKDARVPRDRCFDKISFRNAIDPQQAYLLLDGLSRGYHGHWDGNSILRFTDNGRVWLCEGDYLKGDPKDHNTMTFMRNAESARPGLFSSLESRFDSPQWGAICTRTPEYCGLDWDRHLLWFKPADLFFLIDEATARQPGTYDMKCRFRSLGETKLKDRTWTVTQKGGEQFFLHAPGTGRLSEATDPEDAKNWKAYEFADPTPKLLNHHLARRMETGDRAALFHAFYAGGDSQGKPKLRVARVSPTVIATAGHLPALIGVGNFRSEDLTVKADRFVVGPESVLLVNATEMTAWRSHIATDNPVSLSFDVKRGTGVLDAAGPTRLMLQVGQSGKAVVAGEAIDAEPYALAHLVVPAGRHELSGGLFPGLGMVMGAWPRRGEGKAAPVAEQPDHGITQTFSIALPVEIATLAAGDLDGDGTDEFLAGCADGTVAAVAASGTEVWRHAFGARVNDVATVDLDGDGKAEVACGVENEHLHVLKPDGAELWKHYFEAYRSDGGREGHVRVVLPADFDGDGTPDLAVGCANTKFYVLDREGKVKESNGQPWVVATKHSASALGAADVTGDGQLELFGGYTYFGRALVDFADTGKSRVSNLGGCISGCGAITSADVDDDGKPEAIFADKDGQITACRKAKPGERSVDIVWQKLIGDDAIAKVLADDLDGDGKPEIVVASRSGFVVLLDASGSVQWIRYADNQVTDATLVRLSGGRVLIARGSADGSVVTYDAAGVEVGRWNVGPPVAHIACGEVGNTRVLAAAAGAELRAALLRTH